MFKLNQGKKYYTLKSKAARLAVFMPNSAGFFVTVRALAIGQVHYFWAGNRMLFKILSQKVRNLCLWMD